MNTKTEAFISIQKELQKAQMHITDILSHFPNGLTREEISTNSFFIVGKHYKESSVCGRTNKLLEKGIIEVSGYKISATTKKRVEVLRLVNFHRMMKVAA